MEGQAAMGEGATLRARQRGRLDDTFAEAERGSQRLALRARTIALVAIAVWLSAAFPYLWVTYYLAIVAFALAAGFVRWRLVGSPGDGPWASYVLVLVDALVMTWAFLVPNPLDPIETPITTQLRVGTFAYYFVFLAGLAITYQPRLVLAFGFSAGIMWAIGVAIMSTLPGVHLVNRAGWSADPAAWSNVLFDPAAIDVLGEAQHVFVLLMTSAILALAVRQARRLARRQAATERQRARLAQYFPPNMIDEMLTSADDPGRVRSQNVAVLFIDIVGFTAMSEHAAPERMIALVREFDARVAAAVFAHGGTLDKFLGDGAMATFGTPRAGDRDAANALACAAALLAEIDAINAARTGRAEPPIAVGIGVHFGPVVLGDVGDERRLEYAVLGDAVNLASRLERLTRRLGVPVLASDTAVAAARAADPAAIDGFVPAETVPVRGRAGRVAVWKLMR